MSSTTAGISFIFYFGLSNNTFIGLQVFSCTEFRLDVFKKVVTLQAL